MVHTARRILAWLGFHGLLVLCLFLVVVGGTWGFVELLDEVDEGETQRFDEAAIDFAVKYHGPQYKWLEEIGRDLTALGGIVPLTLVTSFVVGYLLIIRKRGAMWLMLAAVVGGMLISFTLKRWVDRERPPDEGERLSHVYTKSFPSGHSMMSMVVYLTLGSLSARFVKSRVVKAYLIGSALFISFLVGVSRVYMAVHWPTDVLAGWTAGLVWAILCWLVATRLQREHVVEQEGEEPSAAEVDEPEPLTMHDVKD